MMILCAYYIYDNLSGVEEFLKMGSFKSNLIKIH